MLESFPAAMIAGGVLGFLAGLGIGGGSLLMLWLTLIIGISAEAARCINLMFFIPAALCASLSRWRQKTLPISKLPWPVIAGCLFAGGFTLLREQIDTQILKKTFGILLLFTGLRELLYTPKKNPSS